MFDLLAVLNCDYEYVLSYVLSELRTRFMVRFRTESTLCTSLPLRCFDNSKSVLSEWIDPKWTTSPILGPEILLLQYRQ